MASDTKSIIEIELPRALDLSEAVSVDEVLRAALEMYLQGAEHHRPESMESWNCALAKLIYDGDIVPTLVRPVDTLDVTQLAFVIQDRLPDAKTSTVKALAQEILDSGWRKR